MPKHYDIEEVEMPYYESPVVQTKLVIGEIDVEIKTSVSCGQRWWWGAFPGGGHCCEYWAHETRQEAVLCSKLRVAKGFVLKKPKKAKKGSE